MKYRTFGKTGWQVSEISLGGAYIAGRDRSHAEQNATEVVRRAHELGINYIDTAPMYGRSEELLGVALEGISDSFHLATKIGFDPKDFDYRSESVLWSIERSLSRLRVDKLDLVQIHEVNVATRERIMEPGYALTGLREAQKRGLCERIGITGRAIPLLAELAQTGEFDSILVYRDYNPCSQLAAEKVLPAAAERQMGVVVATILAGGLFAGEDRIPEALDRLPDDERPRSQQVIDRLHREPGTLAQNAFQYVLADSRVSTAASGAANVEELEDVIQASDMGPMSESLMQELHQVDE